MENNLTNWSEKFDEKYYDKNTPSGLKQGEFLNFILMVDDIKSFIRSLLNTRMEQHDEEVREELAELEHNQWLAWSSDISSKEVISDKRRKRWGKLWRPYSELTEKEKDQDRVWADRVLAIIREKR